MTSESPCTRLGRRAFVKNGALVLAASAKISNSLLAAESQTDLKVGLVTDLHHADKAAAGSRHYRETIGKLHEATAHFEQTKPDFVVELGDFIDAADSVEIELSYLRTIDREFSAIAKERHYVLGNHCVDTLTKDEFLGEVGQEKSYYSFERAGVHFVVLDSCFRSDAQPYGRKNSKWNDANIPAAQVEWLRADLQTNSKPTVVFAHQRLDVSNDHGVKNCREVRGVFEASGNVQAVFQGHSHQNDYKEIAGIHYCTLVAMVEGSGAENNGYSLMEIGRDGGITLSGYRRQKNYDW